MKDLALSFLPLTDAAPIIVAHARGYFAAEGIRSTLRREGNWTASRDSLSRGTVQAAQMLFSMPVAAACGLLGSDQVPLVIPWVLSRNGQGITLNQSFRGPVAGDARALRPAALAARDAGRPLVFGHTLRIGTHAMLLRYWLAAGGIDPERDVVLITIPPPQMAENMGGGRMHGFCVGEPWNLRVQQAALGYTAITSGEIWPNHPEKVCAFTAAYAAENPDTVVAVLRALHHASIWLDQQSHHDETAALLAQPEFLNCQPEHIRSRLGGMIDYGDGRRRQVAQALAFSRAEANRPAPAHAIWFLTQFRRWGLLFGEPDYAALASRVMRPDLYEQAAASLGLGQSAIPEAPEVLFDGRAFDPAAPADYVLQFDCRHLHG